MFLADKSENDTLCDMGEESDDEEEEEEFGVMLLRPEFLVLDFLYMSGLLLITVSFVLFMFIVFFF